MNFRAVLVLFAALLIGLAVGFYAAASFTGTTPPPIAGAIEASDAVYEDYILNIADAYAADADLRLAQDRLARLHDPEINTRVERFAISYAARHTGSFINLINLAIALGSKNGGLVAVVVTATPPPSPTATRQNAPVFSNVRATAAPTQPPSPTPTYTGVPQIIVIPNDNPFVILPTNTPTITPTRPTNTPTNVPTLLPTRRPNTSVPTPTELPTATPVPPPPPVIWEPGFPGAWPPGVYYEPANVAPGQSYWRLVKAVYCDFVEDNFGCPDRPGNRDGTSIYVINGGAPINVLRGEENIGGDSSQVGELKSPEDVCECSWAFLVSDYKISVSGAPSDAIGGFSLYTVGGNVLAGHAHVRYFLYFDYVTR